MDSIDAKVLLNLMSRQLTFYKEFLQMQNVKLDDMSNDRMRALDEHVKSEEVYFLRSKGLEQERNNFLKKRNLSDQTLREIIKTFPEEDVQSGQEIFDKLSTVILELKQVNLRCNSIAQLRLHRIDVAIKQSQNNPELQKVYQGDASTAKPQRDLLSRKI